MPNFLKKVSNVPNVLLPGENDRSVYKACIQWRCSMSITVSISLKDLCVNKVYFSGK